MRKPIDTAHVNLRIRESLRAKLEREAKAHRTSLNNEIRLRLEDSLEKAALRKADDIVNSMDTSWGRFENRFLLLGLEADLAEALAQSTDPKVMTLARAWLHTKAMAKKGGGA
jgi:Arc-like DNA binding domain